MQILNLATNDKKYFQAIQSGTLSEAYNPITDYFTKRVMSGVHLGHTRRPRGVLSVKSYDAVSLRCGSHKGSPQVIRKFLGISMGTDPKGKDCYIIHLGEILSDSEKPNS